MQRQPQEAMAETSLGAFGAVQTILQSAAAGFAFGEAALFAVEPSLTEDGVLLSAATLAAGRAGSTGVGVVTACLVFTSLLISLGSGFLLAAMVMELLNKVGVRLPWLEEATTGASVVLGAVTTGVLAGILPPWICIAAQGILVLVVYSYSNINEMSTALLIIFTTLYLSVLYGRMGVMVGLFVMGLTISVLCALRKALTERKTQKPKSKSRVQTSGEDILLLCFCLLGAGLGTVATVGLGPEVAGKVALGAAIISSVSLRAILHSSSSLGSRSSMGGTLGAATAAGVSLGAASVAAKQAFGSKNTTLAALGSVVVGALLSTLGLAVNSTPLTISELLQITLVAVGAFVLGAPKSPFNTQVNLQRGLLTGPELIKGIGMETVTAAAAPIGAGALGAAALATAALGRLGTLGVSVAILLALGSALSGMIGKSPQTTNTHTD
ncbi:hypothetical protein CesoFtcFv8_023169 [Champsocephalus esox]|uniref:Uncharacterized protein n=1 Tax=Champsocephalus esox TaxID=159716 RepID=A0AAN8B8X2_9TELE|nr:hypothetical protein CesoFtcFv8_023169 [Champsocephalus esox]